ncbi:hypothetical protein J3F84DRAFT_363140 [Trichoderma pleuroticola]
MDQSTTSLPPEIAYQSREELKLVLDYYAAIGGYKWITRRSNLRKGICRWKILYSCNQFRRGCQFSINVTELCGGSWVIRHRSGAQFCSHNHPTEPEQPRSQLPQMQSVQLPQMQSQLPQTQSQSVLLRQLHQQLQKIEDILQKLPGESERELERELEREPERVLTKKLPTCSKCHVEGHRRGAKICAQLRDP